MIYCGSVGGWGKQYGGAELIGPPAGFLAREELGVCAFLPVTSHRGLVTQTSSRG